MINVINILEDLGDDFTQFSYRCDDMHGEASNVQAMFTEALSSYKVQANHFMDGVENHAVMMNKLEGQQAEYISDYKQVKEYTDGVLDSCYVNLNKAKSLLNHWQNKEQDAEHLVDVARKHLNQAEREYSFAVEECEIAINKYNQALTALSVERLNVIHDQYGYSRPRNPTQLAWLQGILNAASLHLGTCRGNVDITLSKRNECQNNLEAARNWLVTCQYNVKVSMRSYNESEKGVEYAESARDYALEAEVIMGDLAKHMTEQMHVLMQKQQSYVGSVNERIIQSDHKHDAALEEKNKIDNFMESYVELVAGARYKLEERIDLLEQFDRVGNII